MTYKSLQTYEKFMKKYFLIKKIVHLFIKHNQRTGVINSINVNRLH